jgi:hypothetical protein
MIGIAIIFTLLLIILISAIMMRIYNNYMLVRPLLIFTVISVFVINIIFLYETGIRDPHFLFIGPFVH